MAKGTISITFWWRSECPRVKERKKDPPQEPLVWTMPPSMGSQLEAFVPFHCFLALWCPWPRNEVMSEWVSTCLVDGVVLGVSISWVSNLVCGHKGIQTFILCDTGT